MKWNRYSPSQYEAYFKKRDQPKNLKKEEWRAVHAKLSELSAMNIEARVKLSGHVLSPTRIKRSRRYVFPGLEQPGYNPSDGVLVVFGVDKCHESMLTASRSCLASYPPCCH
jgi:hypothetical protein